MNPPWKFPCASRTHRCGIEILESRIAPAVSVALGGIAPGLAVVISDDASGIADNAVTR